jgi:hypothetical protein
MKPKMLANSPKPRSSIPPLALVGVARARKIASLMDRQGFQTNPRCVNRKLTDSLSSKCSAADVATAISGANYDAAWLAIYMGPHLYGHMALAMMVCIIQYHKIDLLFLDSTVAN